MPLAFIHFLNQGGTPEHPIVIPPDWLAPGTPSHPIVIPPPPLGIWGGAPLPHPEHPIAPGGEPPGIWPGPGKPTHPIVIPPDAIAPGVPSHPIVIPPEIWGPTDPRPDQGLPGPQPGPEHPIVLPEPPKLDVSDKALVVVVVNGKAVYIVIDKDENLKPNPWPEPKGKSRR